MQIKIVKGQTQDFVEAHRRDGSSTKSNFPKKGQFPHDVIHFVVESELQLTRGFWGHVYDGVDLEDVTAVAMGGGHRSSSRAQTPASEIIELIQAERIVECFEAELWGQRQDSETFLSILDAACAQSKVATPIISKRNMEAIRGRLDSLEIEWRELAIGEWLGFFWPQSDQQTKQTCYRC